MALDEKISSFVEQSDDPAAAEEAKIAKANTYQPLYQMIGDHRIPISKGHGKLWKSRKDAAVGKLKNSKDVERWDTAIAYYRNDHTDRRDQAEVATDKAIGTNLATKGRETENLVFANASAMVPAIYAKNPKVEMTADNAEYEDFMRCLEKLVNVILTRKSSPGVNLKPKARRAVLMSTLTNISYVEVGWTNKEDSSEQVLDEIKQIGEQLVKAKKKDIPELEAQLLVLEEKVDLLFPAGPWVKFRKPHDVLIDPDATDLDDARWIMIGEYLNTEFIKVQYGEKNEDGTYNSVYKPTHVLKLDSRQDGGLDGEIASFSLFSTDGEKSGKDYGYEDEEAFSKACRTKVWYVWDKATRRVYMYADNDWNWPLWVWDDPYGYDNFFPIVPLEFYIDPTETYARSETLMYLDQQDAVNQINNEVAKIRDFAVGKVVYNKNILKDEGAIDNFLAGTTRKRALGIDAPADADLSKLISPLVPQSAHLLQTVIFDKQRLIEAIDRVSSVTNVMRGVEYKTNTTNKAIESYQSNTQSRLDEKIDAVEDFVGAIGWKIAQLCVAKMDPETVAAFLGPQFGELWNARPDIATLQQFFSCTCVGGSSLKPTSATKKEMAVQIGQVLGQFVQASPAALLIALKVMERAFDEVIISAEEWQMISAGIQQAMGAQAEGGSGEDALAKVEQIIDSFPPEAKAMLSDLLKEGTPIREAVSAVVQELEKDQAANISNPDQGVQ